MRDVQFLSVSLHICDKFFEIPGWKVPSCHYRDGNRNDQTDRREVNIRFVGKVRVESDRGGVRSHLTHLDGISIGVGAHCPDRASGATGAGDVLDDYLLAEGARHVLAHDAGSYVRPSTRGKRYNHRNRPGWIRLRGCDLRHHRQHGSARGQPWKLPSVGNFHDDPPKKSRRARMLPELLVGAK